MNGGAKEALIFLAGFASKAKAYLKCKAKGFTRYPTLLSASIRPGNSKGGSITVPLTSHLIGLESAV